MTNEYKTKRHQLFAHTNIDLNLRITNNDDVFLAVIDVPNESKLTNNEVISIGILFDTSVQLYFGNGKHKVGLEQDQAIMRAMQMLLVNLRQVSSYSHLANAPYQPVVDNKAIYYKNGNGVFKIDLLKQNRGQIFIHELVNDLIRAINSYLLIQAKQT